MPDLVSMKMSSTEQKKMAEPTMTADKPQFPYGLCLELNEEILTKLGIKNLPKVGSYLMVMARAEVVSVSMNAYEDGEHKHVRLQITEMAAGVDEKKKSTEEALYGG